MQKEKNIHLKKLVNILEVRLKVVPALDLKIREKKMQG